VSNVAHVPSFSCLENSHTLVYIFHFPSRVKDATGALCAPYTQQEDYGSGKCGKL
jgi:hypothetical protein